MRLNAMTGINYTELRPKTHEETPEEIARNYASLDRVSYGMFPVGRKPYKIPGGVLVETAQEINRLHLIGGWEEVPKKPTCPKCGAWLHAISVGSHYCYSCGTRLKWEPKR